MQYRKDNPHPGAILKAVLESFDSSGDKNTHKPKAQRTPEEQKQFEKEQLQALISQFGNCGSKPKRKIVKYVC